MTRRAWRTPRLPDLVGSAEALEILGVQKAALARWLRPGSGTPESSHGPDRTYMLTPKRIRSGPVWARSDVERFAAEIGRQRAPVGEARPRGATRRSPEQLREHIAQLEAQLAALEGREVQSVAQRDDR